MARIELFVRRPLPTFAQAQVDAEEKGVSYALEFLTEHGFMHAAHRLSVDYWGYGMEDTDGFLEEWNSPNSKGDSQ